MSSRKISARRRSDFSGPRRSIPPVNQQKRELRAALFREERLITALMEDAAARRAVERGHGLPQEPMSVWHDSDHSWSLTEVAPHHLPKWHTLTEQMKLFIGFDVGREFQACYAFTAHISPTMMCKWESHSHGFMKNVRQRLSRELSRSGIADIPYCFVAETRAKGKRSKTRPHIHGFLLTDNPYQATSFQVALECAFHPALRKERRTKEIDVEPAYDKDGEFVGRSVWPLYILKNCLRYDPLLKKRRLYMSHSFTEVARLSWDARRDR